MVDTMRKWLHVLHHWNIILPSVGTRLWVLPILLGWSMACNSPDNQENQLMERQITLEDYGHFLNPVQSFSPDDRWLAYDTRNDDAHIGRTGQIERVNIQSGGVEVIYAVEHQTIHGPGVGAVAYSPVEDQVIFIHGMANANADRPYGITRRTGVVAFTDRPGKITHFDARDVYPPFSLGALRGGSHAHSWNGDGTCISFTYNDEIMAQLSREDTSIQDLRTVGVMMPWGGVDVPNDPGGENISGAMFSMVVTKVTENPEWGSDEISKAYEDGWIGGDGYTDGEGNRHTLAIACLGDVRSTEGELVTEVFVVDLPASMPSLDGEDQIKGDLRSRPQPLSMVHQRRVTFTTDRRYPGVQGPRQWMKSAPDGEELYFMMKDDDGIVQLYSVPTVGGNIRQITRNDFSITTAFDIDPTGRRVVYGADEKIYVSDLENGDTRCLTPSVPQEYSGLRAIQWSRSGRMVAYNRKVPAGDSSFYQIFTLSIPANE